MGKNVAYSSSYVDSIIQARNIPALITLIDIRERIYPLPDECELFRELIFWLGATRSGIYQYYENRKANDPKIIKVAALLEKFHFYDALEKYISGVHIWNEVPQDLDRYDAIETWIESNEIRLISLAINVLVREIQFLKNNNAPAPTIKCDNFKEVR